MDNVVFEYYHMVNIQVDNNKISIHSDFPILAIHQQLEEVMDLTSKRISDTLYLLAENCLTEFNTSTKGTSATAMLIKSERKLIHVPISIPPALRPV